jgi:hypothetical protein
MIETFNCETSVLSDVPYCQKVVYLHFGQMVSRKGIIVWENTSDHPAGRVPMEELG